MHRQYALSAWKSMKACMRREVILVYRHSFVYLFRIAQVGASALVCQRAWSQCCRAYSLHSLKGYLCSSAWFLSKQSDLSLGSC